jgi:LysM domain
MVTMVRGKPTAAMEHGCARDGGARFRTGGARSAVRLTRRGRVVAAGASALAVGALSIVLATAAQYVARVEVRPGQSLWLLAEAYDPDADPRLVIQQIQQLNSMAGDQVQPGEVLWVPRG